MKKVAVVVWISLDNSSIIARPASFVMYCETPSRVKTVGLLTSKPEAVSCSDNDWWAKSRATYVTFSELARFSGNLDNFLDCTSDWSTSKIFSEDGRSSRCARKSYPAPRMTYCWAPVVAAFSTKSSMKRVRAIRCSWKPGANFLPSQALNLWPISLIRPAPITNLAE